MVPKRDYNSLKYAKEKWEKLTKLDDIIEDFTSKAKNASEENKEQLKKELNQRVENYNELKIEPRKYVAPYEFWLYCRLFFGFKTLNSRICIECLNQEDALPNWLNLLELRESNKNAHKIKELFYSHWYFAAIQSALSQIFLAPGRLLKDELEKLLYIGPIRSRIPRNYEPDSIIDNRKWADGIASWDVLYNADQNFLDKLNYWMEERLKTGYIIEKQTGSNLQIVNKNNKIKLRPIDIGVGISQVLPIIVASLYAKEGLVAIEQPELHIHPAFQVELGDLFLSQIKDKNICFLIETHSEHLLLRIMKRLRQLFEGENIYDNNQIANLNPDDIAVYYVELYKGNTIVRRMPLNEKGELVKSWPGGFFEEGFREVF